MNAHVTVQDLKVLDDTPRMLDLRLAEALAFSQPIDIRKLVRRNQDELAKYGEVFATVAKTTPNGGRPGEEFWLNEPQSILICMFSRTDKAAEVRREIIEVFMAWRRGHLLPGGAASPAFDFPAEGGPLQAYALKLDTVRLCSRVHGIAVARAMWNALGLPPAPGYEPEKDDEAQRCLAHLLSSPITEAGDFGAVTLRQGIELALDHGNDDPDGLAATLRRWGIKIIDQGDVQGFAVANSHPEIERMLFGTSWKKTYPYVLRRLPGAKPWQRMLSGTREHRTTFIPADLLAPKD
jgi:hypothetical protein